MNKNVFNYWVNSQDLQITEIKNFNINFGPQHPASHGVLRVVLQLKGEIIEKADTHIGLLHRGTEKLIETRPYLLGLPYFDRLDYTAILMQEHAYCLGVETLLGNTNYWNDIAKIRVVFDELTRILNHLIALSTHSMDVGTMAIFFWAFEEREKIMELYERVSGARMHAAFYRPNDINLININRTFIKDLVFFCRDLIKRVAQIEFKLANTSIWKQRLVNVGMLNPSFIKTWGITGPLARSAGINSDLRLHLHESYGSYYYLKLKSFTGTNGDCYDRFLIRMREMAESVHIILQVISEWVSNNKIYLTGMVDILQLRSFVNFFRPPKLNWTTNMEELITHFKHFGEGLQVARGATYKAVESAKGEFGVFMVADGSQRPYRCRIRSPAYFHTQLFAPMSQGNYFADLITIIGSQDIVMGEVDRINGTFEKIKISTNDKRITENAYFKIFRNFCWFSSVYKKKCLFK